MHRRRQAMAIVAVIAALLAAPAPTSCRQAHAFAMFTHRRQPARQSCPVLLPRGVFPLGITVWESKQTLTNAGAIASGLQQAHYRWGYVLVTPDVYPNTAAARRRYREIFQLLRGDRQVRLRRIGQEMVTWITRDQVAGYTITTILLRAGKTVAMINVAAGGSTVDVAAHLARAVDRRACH